MLYHLLLGEVPFKGERPLDVAHKIVNGDCTRPRELREDLSQDVEWVLLRMLDPDRQFRYDGMPALLRDLARLKAGQSPKIPCLEPLDPIPGVTDFPLLPGKLWTVGRQSSNDLALRHGTISRKHAEIHRLPSGYVVRDEGSSYGTFMGERRVREAVLTDGAEVRFGELRFVFRNGQRRAAGNSGRGGAARLVPGAFLEVLAEEGDPRLVLALIERLEPQTHDGRVVGARETVERLLDDTRARQVAARLDTSLRRSKAVAVDYLERITNRARSEDASEWLCWWGEEWSAYPSQLGPILPARQELELCLLGDDAPEQPRFSLTDWLAFTVGRDEHSAIHLTDLSVSRLHATIQRLDQRTVIRDEGSRSGTVLNGNRVQIAFLRAGDRVTLGKVQLEVAETRQSPVPELGNAHWVEPALFEALLEVSPRSTALALARLCRESEPWIAAQADRLAPSNPKLRVRLQDAAGKVAAGWLQIAQRTLPTLLGSEEPRDWLDPCKAREDELGPQVFPVGWGLDAATTRIRLKRPKAKRV
jgi:pSer/pThr/pTyr-binding forkhead associated (FHA) protein